MTILFAYLWELFFRLIIIAMYTRCPNARLIAPMRLGTEADGLSPLIEPHPNGGCMEVAV